MKHRLIFLRQCCILEAPVIWTTCRVAKILGFVFYNSLEKIQVFVVIRQCVHVTFT